MSSSAIPSSGRACHPACDAVTVADLDQRLAAAWTALAITRDSFTRDPSGAVVTACESAEAALNELLDQRFAITHGRSAGRRMGSAG
jgi:hypothetical protein